MAFNKADLITKLERLGFPENEVVLTFDEFFVGNHFENSIGVNIYPNKPSVSLFRNTFFKLLEEKLVDSIFIRVIDIEEPEEWVFSDTVYIIGSISIELLEERIRDLFPDDINEGWVYEIPVNIGPYDKTKNVFTIFWD